MKTYFKKIIIFIIVLLPVSLSAKNSISFEKGNWTTIVEKAKKEKKLIFVDFYTQWCGPCLNMAEEVFILPSVYEFYNSNFINAKIDAENGEGIDLAKKYGINSYPTYLFIDPNTETPVHRSSGRQEPSVFIFTGESAMNPVKTSVYLDNNYEKFKGDLKFLNDYATYKSSVYDREAIQKVLMQLGTMNVGMDNPLVWKLYTENIAGYDNRFFKEIAANYEKYVKIYGKESVDSKLAKETSYAPVDLLEILPDFTGRETNIVNNKISLAVREKDYSTASFLIDEAIKNPSVDRSKFLNSLRFIVRLRTTENYSDEWRKKCGEYLRYIAYNFPDRNDSYVHFEYAQYLESVIKEIHKNSSSVPESIINKPAFGKSEYTMRPDNLKQKPVKNTQK